MQFVSWATLLTLLVRDLAEMASPDAAAAVRKDRLHPRQGNEAPAPGPFCPCRRLRSLRAWSGHPAAEASFLFLERMISRFAASPFFRSFPANFQRVTLGKELTPTPFAFNLLFSLPQSLSPKVP